MAGAAAPSSSSTSLATTSDPAPNLPIPTEPTPIEPTPIEPTLIVTGPVVGAGGGWRHANAADGAFLYHLVVSVGARCWRLTRLGNAPTAVVQAIQQCNAGVVVTDPGGEPVGAAFLAEGSLVAGTAVLDLFALPDPAAEAIVAAVAPGVVATAFDATDLRLLYHEGFVDDPDLLGEVGSLFEEEVRYPDYAWIDGAFRDRRTRCLTAERWWRAHPELVPEHLRGETS